MTLTMLTNQQATERDTLCRFATGHTWEQLALIHEMLCGACRDGWLQLDGIAVVMTPFAPTETRLTLVCSQCGIAVDMTPFTVERRRASHDG